MKLSRILWLITFGSPILYIGSYLLMVETAVEKVAQTVHVVAHYRVGGKVAENLYAPLHHLDTQIRQKYWQVQ